MPSVTRLPIVLLSLVWGMLPPNPLVGCVITDAQGHLLAVGAHHRYGEAHAEAQRRRASTGHGGGAECLRGARLFVTLQPCTHQGKTPPLQRAVACGVAWGEVHYGTDDPQPTGRQLNKITTSRYCLP